MCLYHSTMFCAGLLPHATTGRTRLLNWCNKIVSNKVRFCSSDINSNANFPSFSTKGDFQDFTKSPNMTTIVSIVNHGECVPPKATLFSDQMLKSSLLEGSLYAVEAVTQTISKHKNIKASNLTSQLTSDCLNRLDAALAKLNSIDQIGIKREDIFFAWLGKYNESKNRMRICTMSYPCHNILRQNPLKEESSERRKLAISELEEHMSKNDIIVSNWDFVIKDNQWKIGEIAMRKLGETDMTKPFHFRWKFRLKNVYYTNRDIVQILQFDYFTDVLLITLFIIHNLYNTFFW